MAKRYYDNGAFYSVQFGQDEVRAFTRRWPGHNLHGVKSVWAQFDRKNGDLVDLKVNNGDSEPWDGPALVALVGDMQNAAADNKGRGGKPKRRGNLASLAEDNGVGRTILEQLGGVGRIRVMTGAKNFILLPNGVTFQFPNPQRSRGNVVEVTLAGDDTYTVKFYNLAGRTKKLVHEVDGIYFDQLKGVFERQTGLYLSFGGGLGCMMNGNGPFGIRS